jgi:hypothetical protein
MSTVRKRHGERTFAGARGNDGVAPIPAIRVAMIGRLKPTHCGHPEKKRS